jgi:antitoxin MazE
MFILIPLKATIQRWGNSLAVRLPKPIAQEINVRHGSEVDLQLDSGRVVLTPTRRIRRYNAKALLAKITPENTPSADVWGAPRGKEIW